MDLQISVAKAAAQYGTLKAWARELGIPYTTVREWREKGVPHWRVEKVAARAIADGKDIFITPKKRARAA